MQMEISIKPKVLLLLLFTGVASVLISVFFVFQIDYIVHHTLYEFGLRFSYEWAERYWIYIRLILGLLGLTVVLNCVSAAYIQVGSHIGITLKPLLIGVLLFVGALASALSAFFFNQLDLIVHGDLYRFGLQFNYLWAQQYWVYARLTASLIGLLLVINLGSIGYVLAAHFTLDIAPNRLVTWFLLGSGTIALSLSVIYESSIVALIGLGLVFWGAIILYVRPEAYVKETLLSTTALPPIENLNQIINELGYRGREVYLPPKYLAEFESSKVYISAKEDLHLPAPEQVEQHQRGIFLKEPRGILLTPLGAELTRLFESILGRSFTTMNLQSMELNLTKMFVEDLEIARNFEMKSEKDRVLVRIEDLILKDVYKEAKRMPNIQTALDNPISSAIACALAKATGRPIVIEKEQISKDDQIIGIEYRLLEEPHR